MKMVYLSLSGAHLVALLRNGDVNDLNVLVITKG